MSDYDDTNKFVLFKETEKKKEKSPDYTGKINIGPEIQAALKAGIVEFHLAGWIGESKNGKKYLQGSVDLFLADQDTVNSGADDSFDDEDDEF